MALSVCPACDYPCKGLPTDYACPECGFYYTSEMMVFPLSASYKQDGRYTVRFWLNVTVLVIVALYLAFVVFAGVLRGHTGALMNVAGSLFVIGLVTYRLRQGLYFRSFATLTDEGIQLMCGTRFLKRIPWEKIAQAKHDLNVLVLTASNGDKLAFLKLDTWDYSKQQVEFTREVKRRLAERKTTISS